MNLTVLVSWLSTSVGLRLLPLFCFTALPVSLVSLSGCDDPVQRDIDRLIEGGDDAEEARIALNLARKAAIGPLIEAFQYRDNPPRARVDIAQALYRLYLREEDKGILEALVGGLEDRDAVVRVGVAKALGDLGKREAVGPLIGLLARERDDAIREEVLDALESLGMGTEGSPRPDSPITTER